MQKVFFVLTLPVAYYDGKKGPLGAQMTSFYNEYTGLRYSTIRLLHAGRTNPLTP